VNPEARILVVEDDRGIGEGLRDGLTGNGYQVEWYRTGLAAKEMFDVFEPDLVVLDIGLPDTDGFSLCRWMRQQRQDLPIVLVTARDAEIDVIVGLDAGATDYVTKPFSLNVLLARIRAHLRTIDVSPTSAYRIGTVDVDLVAHTVRIAGVAVELRLREFELLAYLAARIGQVVTRDQLLADVWDTHWATNSKTVDMHVMALRRKLAPAIEITAIRGLGYRLEHA
jgi:DNA-binding response OmpR family regulator